MRPISILFWSQEKVAVAQQQKGSSTNNSVQKFNPSGGNLPSGSLSTQRFHLQQFVLLLLECSLSTICLFQLIMLALGSHKVINPNHSVHFHTCQIIIQHLAYLFFYPSGMLSHTNMCAPRRTQVSIFSLHLVIMNATHCPRLHNGKQKNSEGNH